MSDIIEARVAEIPKRRYAMFGNVCDRCGNIRGSLCNCEVSDLKAEVSSLAESLAAARQSREVEWERAKVAREEVSKVRSELDTARAAQQKLTDAVRWALGENGEFPEADEALYEVIARGKRAMCESGDVPRRALRLYWWRGELRERAFGASTPSSPKAATESQPEQDALREKGEADAKRVMNEIFGEGYVE